MFSALGLLLACNSATPQPAITIITIGPETLHTHVKRLGINLSGQSFYDSGQMLRNLAFRNPGFEGETWQSILHCKSVTPTTCTDENQYAIWPANFLAGAHYEFLSGLNLGSSGTVQSSSAASGQQGVILTFAAPAKSASAGDFLLVRIDKPGTAEAGWWSSLQNGASYTTEFHDLSPNTPGKQALRVDASAPTASATISSYFDSFNGRSFLQLHTPLTLQFRAKWTPHPREARVGSDQPANLQVNLERLDTTHGRHTFFAKSIPLTPTWRDYTFTFPADDVPNAVGTIGLTFTITQSTVLLDDVALTAPAAKDNPTAFRDEAVQTLRDLRPGILRYMDNGTDFGSSLDNMLAAPFARRRTGASTQAILQEDIPIGLDEFLQLCKAVDAEPWYSMPPGTTPAEAAALIEYLSGAPTTRYGQLRASLGQREPWTAVFATIHLELGNEQWNHQSFAGSTINDPTAYGQRAAQIFSAMRTTAGFDPARFDLILGSWATVPWWTQQEIASSSAFDSVALAPYLFNDFNDASSSEAVFGPMFAEPETIDSRPTGYMAQQAALLQPAKPSLGLAWGFSPTKSSDRETAASQAAEKGRGALTIPSGAKALVVNRPFTAGLKVPPFQNTGFSAASSAPGRSLAVYEVNLGSMTGGANITQSDIDHAIPSVGAGLAVADHMLLMLRDLGITNQCLFALPEYVNNFSAPGPKRMIPLWGAVVDMGGPTNARRPQFLAEQLANQAILPIMLATHLAGPPHTWNQPESPNDKVKLADAHLLQTFAFTEGARHSLILLNLSRTETIPVTFAGPTAPRQTVEESRLTSSNITDSNESTSLVAVHHQRLTVFNPSAPYPLPPFSMTVLTWAAVSR